MNILRRINNVADVAQWRLCLGCGACAPACPEKAVLLVNIENQGIRPIISSENCKKCGECLKVCPGIEITHQSFQKHIKAELKQSWGPVLEIWEGYAVDSEIRYKGSSGGAVTALALFCLEKEKAQRVLHIGTHPEEPLQNIAVLSRSKEELLVCTGSRYSPAALCEKLDWLREKPGTFVFIGKPCDIVALRKSQVQNTLLENKINLTISIFCAGTPSIEGTYGILNKLNLRADQVDELRYRGCGWPGMTSVKIKGANNQTKQLSYRESWDNILSKYTQFRCHFCPDSTGEFADISFGDSWHRKVKSDEQGWSLVLVRTKRGQEILQEAVEEGYLRLESVVPDALPQSQKSLLNRRCHLWGRLFVMKLMCIPFPKYTGFSLFKNWLMLTTIEKFRSFCGTLRRIIVRGWMKPLKKLRLDSVRQTNITDNYLINPKEFESKCKA